MDLTTRMSFARTILVLSLLCASAPPAAAKSAGESFFVSPSWLAERLNDPALVLLHVGDKADYEQEHIPGAQFISLDELSLPRGQGLTLQMAGPEALAETLESWGISDKSTVVVCFAKDWITPAARTILALVCAGMGRRSYLLDGGLNAWKSEGRPVTADVRPNHRGSLRPQSRNDIIVGIDWLSANLNNSQLRIIDARTPNYYDGSSAGRMPRAGHIPGATNIPYSSIVDESLHLKSAALLARQFRDAAASPDQMLVVYCHIGQQASLVYLAARYLGYDVRLFDGSFEEWSARKDLPVTVSSNP